MRRSILIMAAVLALLGVSACTSLPDKASPRANLVLKFEPEKQRFEKFSDDEVLLYLWGTIRNTGPTTVAVPKLLVVLRDDDGQPVLERVIVPTSRDLEPGYTLVVQKTIARPPESAIAVEVDWAPSR